jgi:hypothetical protein
MLSGVGWQAVVKHKKSNNIAKLIARNLVLILLLTSIKNPLILFSAIVWVLLKSYYFDSTTSVL